MGNLFNNLPTSQLPEEIFTNLLKHKNIKIEKIISTGQITPPDELYDQQQAEWVIVLQGQAIMWLEDQGEVALGVGDYLYIEPHVKHKVTYTSSSPVTVWLAVHIYPDAKGCE